MFPSLLNSLLPTEMNKFSLSKYSLITFKISFVNPSLWVLFNTTCPP
jgi:hypothetical protein